MAHFDFTNLTDNAVPRDGKIAVLGPACAGTPAYVRNLQQFLNGAPIVDYGSVSYTAAGTASDGKLLAVDSRAGSQMGSGAGDATSGYTPNVAETWTITFASATTFNVSGSTSGALSGGPFSVATDVVEEDLIYIHVGAASSNAWVSGDVITVSFLANPLTAAADKWIDPDPYIGYIDSGTQYPALTVNGSGFSSNTEMIGLRMLYSDPSQLADATEYVYMMLGCYSSDAASDNSTYGETLFVKGYQSYDAGGGHVGPSTGTYMISSVLEDLGGHFVADGYRFVPVISTGTGNNFGYFGQYDSYMTKDEFSYPTLVCGNWADTTLPGGNWTATSWPTMAQGMHNRKPTEYVAVDGNWVLPTDNSSSGFEYLHTPSMLSPLASQMSVSEYNQNGMVTQSALAPVRSGAGEVPLIPILVTNLPSNDTMTNSLNNEVNNPYRGREAFGSLRGMFACGEYYTTEGGSVTVGADTYLTLGGKNQSNLNFNSTYRQNFRVAIKLS